MAAALRSVALLVAAQLLLVAAAAAPRGAERSVSPPFGDAALWAASLIPEACDSCERQGDKVACDVGGCQWTKVPASWRYVWNNLRLAVEAAEVGHRRDLGGDVLAQLATLHSYVDRMGDDLGLWFSNWLDASEAARNTLDYLQPWLQEGTYRAAAPLLLPAGNHGLRAPLPGRSAQVPVDGDVGRRVTLSNGVELPLLGLGLAGLASDAGGEDEAYQSVRWALELGYRHLDTAQLYRNEGSVGRAIRDSGVPRRELVVATKLSNTSSYASGVRAAFEAQLEALGLDYVDLYMLHVPGKDRDARLAAWRQLEALYDEGRIRALGVSGFATEELQDLLSVASVKPVFVQNKFSVYSPGGDHEARRFDSFLEFATSQGLTMVGYGIVKPATVTTYLAPLSDPHVLAVSRRVGRSPSQVLHRWALQMGVAVIPRSSQREHIVDNMGVFEFALEESDMRLLNGIASLTAGTPGRRAPRWCEDVYGLGGLPAEM